MGCNGGPAKRKSVKTPAKELLPGGGGMVLVSYIGDETLVAPIKGAHTNIAYPFDKKGILYVDLKDAVYLLGMEFVPCPR